MTQSRANKLSRHRRSSAGLEFLDDYDGNPVEPILPESEHTQVSMVASSLAERFSKLLNGFTARNKKVLGASGRKPSMSKSVAFIDRPGQEQEALLRPHEEEYDSHGFSSSSSTSSTENSDDVNPSLSPSSSESFQSFHTPISNNDTYKDPYRPYVSSPWRRRSVLAPAWPQRRWYEALWDTVKIFILNFLWETLETIWMFTVVHFRLFVVYCLYQGAVAISGDPIGMEHVWYNVRKWPYMDSLLAMYPWDRSNRKVFLLLVTWIRNSASSILDSIRNSDFANATHTSQFAYLTTWYLVIHTFYYVLRCFQIQEPHSAYFAGALALLPMAIVLLLRDLVINRGQLWTPDALFPWIAFTVSMSVIGTSGFLYYHDEFDPTHDAVRYVLPTSALLYFLSGLQLWMKQIWGFSNWFALLGVITLSLRATYWVQRRWEGNLPTWRVWTSICVVSAGFQWLLQCIFKEERANWLSYPLITLFVSGSTWFVYMLVGGESNLASSEIKNQQRRTLQASQELGLEGQMGRDVTRYRARHKRGLSKYDTGYFDDLQLPNRVGTRLSDSENEES